MRIVAAQKNYHIANFLENTQLIIEALRIHGNHCDLLVFTELALSGYYPYDLIERESFFEQQQHAIEHILQESTHYTCAMVLGYIAKNQESGKKFHNSLMVLNEGKILYTYHKQLLPVYNIFDEARHFQPGKAAQVFTWRGANLGFLICEDIWGSFEGLYSLDPIQQLQRQQVDILIVINGSPSNLGKMEQRLQQAHKVVEALQKPLLYVNQVGGNDDIVYDGQSFLISSQGKIMGTLSAFREGEGIFELYSKQNAVGEGNNSENASVNSIQSQGIRLIQGFEPYHKLEEAEFLYQQITLGLKDYLKKCGFKGVVVGVSGGIDSAITLALAAKALGSEKVHGIFMPSQFTSKVSLESAQLLCDTLSVKLYHYPIQPAFEQALATFKKVFAQEPNPITKQNIQARLRGRILMEYSNHSGFMVLATGNKSEISVGYTTIYGDMTGGFNIIGDVYKTQVYDLAQYFNEHNPDTPIPHAIISREPTAELAPNQKDSDLLPPYSILDPILKLYLEGDLLQPQDKTACEEIQNKLPTSLIQQVHQLVDKAEFKRRQSPPILRVQRRSFGFGRKMPICAHYLLKKNSKG